jgi:hypothetical protein
LCCIQLAQPAESVPRNLELPLHGGLALIIGKVCGQKATTEDFRAWRKARSAISIRASGRFPHTGIWLRSM